jgi:hypothetical protein
MSIPYELRNPCKMNNKRQLDIELIIAHLLPHAALIILYEPFADVTDSSDAPARRILSAAQAIVGIVQQLAASINGGASNFAGVMHSAASVLVSYPHPHGTRLISQLSRHGRAYMPTLLSTRPEHRRRADGHLAPI